MIIHNALLKRAEEARQEAQVGNMYEQMMATGRALGIEEAAAIYLSMRVAEDAAG